MSDYLTWQYDEFQQVGKDYGSSAEVAHYDASHAAFRDAVAEAEAILDTLALQPGDQVIDFGAGTGTFAIQAARRGIHVYAVDVSQAMLEHARAKAHEAGVTGITFCHGGFLTYEHAGPPAKAVVTSSALHHLPDFWKGVALQRIQRLLRPGGQINLHDVILEEADALANIATFIDQQAAAGGDFLRDDAEGHFRYEHSTYDWVIEGLLTRTGFTVERKQMQDGVIG